MTTIDRDALVYHQFDAQSRERIRALVTPEIIAEHAADPNGMHSDALQRVLAYFRRGLIAGKYIVVAAEPFSAYRIGMLNGDRGTPITVLDNVYPSEKDVLHAIFLRRLNDIGALP
ncbi:hypothetical protein AXA44_20150 [Rhodococcus sp. SC4]|uniref:hypothetical protein n=1 Tax=Rhodococcus sp. LB1 TaxID=1807499 RepID=UPI000769D91E|nr:hypothetical protein [Rhodococcus sp. LB1]KXF50348.1 hypothetical protein AXA44_20150 [Rhodococcus sp. SC4]KXX58592.1 hypothetical protein AZG88_45115 [Rhodococcus sp. LB1]